MTPGVSWAVIIAFDVLAIFIIFSLLLVILTAAFSCEVRRKATWFNFMLPIMFYPASFLLLLGNQGSTQQPFSLCAFQAVLVHAIPVLCTTGFGCFVIDFYYVLRQTFIGDRPPKVASRVLLVLPAVIFAAVLIIETSVILGNEKIRSTLRPDASGIYCHTANLTPLYLTVVVCLPGLCVWFFVFYKITVLLRQHKPTIAQYDDPVRRRVLSVLLRTTLMTVTTIIGIALDIRAAIVPSAKEQPANVLLYLGMPLMALLIFGTQSEFFKCWTCRRPTEPPQNKSLVMDWHPPTTVT